MYSNASVRSMYVATIICFCSQAVIILAMKFRSALSVETLVEIPYWWGLRMLLSDRNGINLLRNSFSKIF